MNMPEEEYPMDQNSLHRFNTPSPQYQAINQCCQSDWEADYLRPHFTNGNGQHPSTGMSFYSCPSFSFLLLSFGLVVFLAHRVCPMISPVNISFPLEYFWSQPSFIAIFYSWYTFITLSSKGCDTYTHTGIFTWKPTCNWTPSTFVRTSCLQRWKYCAVSRQFEFRFELWRLIASGGFGDAGRWGTFGLVIFFFFLFHPQEYALILLSSSSTKVVTYLNKDFYTLWDLISILLSDQQDHDRISTFMKRRIQLNRLSLLPSLCSFPCTYRQSFLRQTSSSPHQFTNPLSIWLFS